MNKIDKERLSVIRGWRDNVQWHIDTNGRYLWPDALAAEEARVAAWTDVLRLWGEQ